MLIAVLDKVQTIQNKLKALLRKDVDYIMVINQNGRAESVFSKNKITLSKEKQEIFFMSFRLHHSLLRDFNDDFGPVGCFVIHRRNAKMVSVPFDSYNIVLIMKNDVEHESLIDRIKKIEESSVRSVPEPKLCVETVSNA